MEAGGSCGFAAVAVLSANLFSADLPLIGDPLDGTMRPLLLAAMLSSALISQPGCVAPGSAMGEIAISGSLTASSGGSIANEEVQVLLPASYGLGGLDLVMNIPEDFGHKDEEHSTRTDSAGSFQIDLGQRIYHMSFWLLPPLGGFPKYPPAPFFYLRIPSLGGEFLGVESGTGKFKIFSPVGTEISLDESKLHSIQVRKTTEKTSDWRRSVGIVELVLD